MNYLGYTQTELEAAGGLWTAREILQQPVVWRKIEQQLEAEAPALRTFLRPLLERPDLRIILTGAGTSAFVGECLAPALKRSTQRRVDAIPTTNLVGSPDGWFEPNVPTLLISFARSGDSPESIAALDLAELCLKDRHHLILTCNPQGKLYQQASRLSNARVVLLPEETDDRGFAMTSSFTGMILASACAFELLPRERALLSQAAAHVLEPLFPYINNLARSGFERLVYLGGQELNGLAREAALKTLELSDGNVVALAETPLGFRHGPKTIVNRQTLIVMFLSNDPYSRRYERDLLKELRADGVAGRVVSLSAGQDSAGTQDDLIVPLPATAASLALCFPFAVFAQSLAFLRSMTLGLRPDSPNARGVVNRVVQGVSIHPWNSSR
jgi:tagatose-6-phosphate ketose/aldose isomerase